MCWIELSQLREKKNNLQQMCKGRKWEEKSLSHTFPQFPFKYIYIYKYYCLMTHSLHPQVHQFSININETLCMICID